MRIKRDAATGNEYIAADGVWVRNFAKPCTSPVTLSPMIAPCDHELLITNEHRNTTRQLPNIADETVRFAHAVIVSDGYQFDARHRWLSDLPPTVAVLGVNGSLAQWALASGPAKRAMNLYITNNPYPEAMQWLPRSYFPACVASLRTHHAFVQKYRGRLYLYSPTPAVSFGLEHPSQYYIDDYRNPVCAAIGLAYRFGVRKLALLCCDDSLVDPRPGAIRLDNGLYAYPQHLKCHRLVDANLYWLTHQEDRPVEVCDASSGPEYTNARYIETKEDLMAFFSDDQAGVPR